MIDISTLPHLQAFLNFISALLLSIGFYNIKRQNRNAHKACMLSALFTSILFVICYSIYHLQVGSVKFTGTGLIRKAYFIILISHTILAVAAGPMIIVTLFRALKENFDKHKRIATVTFPVWIYISVTGVIIYWMVYHYQ